MKADIKLTITRRTPLQVNALLALVAESMHNNPAFPDPVIPLAEMRALHVQFTDLINAATDGSKLAKLQRNQLQARAMDMLRAQANYVRAKAHGNAAILVSSGFELQRERQRIGLPDAPQLLPAKVHQSGALKFRWNRVPGAKAYKVFFAPEASATLELLTITTSASHVITGLDSFKLYRVQVSAIGVAGEGEKSQMVISRAM